jgi:hypothetical protein
MMMLEDCPAFAAELTRTESDKEWLLFRMKANRQTALESVTSEEIQNVISSLLNHPIYCRYQTMNHRIIALDIRFEKESDSPSINRRYILPIPDTVLKRDAARWRAQVDRGEIGGLNLEPIQEAFERIRMSLNSNFRGRGIQRALHRFDSTCDCRDRSPVRADAMTSETFTFGNVLDQNS